MNTDYFLSKIHPDWIPFFTENKKELDKILETVLSSKIYPKKKKYI